jgi:engulfment and cell motility protein 1
MHASALEYIWRSSKLPEETDSQGNILKWRKLGFDSEDIVNEFNEVGVLGLDCLVRHIHNLWAAFRQAFFVHTRINLLNAEKLRSRRPRVFLKGIFNTTLSCNSSTFLA